MAGIRIDALPTTTVPTKEHEFPAMKDGLSVKLSVQQVGDSLKGTTPGTLAAGDDARIAGAVPSSRQVATTGLASGGGDLSANRTINVPKSTNGQATAGTDDTTAMTPLRVREAIDGRAVGVGQTWQNVAGSRVAGTSYQNTTGKPIQIAVAGISADGSAKIVQVSANNSTWIDIVPFDGSSGTHRTASFIVPDLWYYRINASPFTTSRWAELR